MVNATGMETEFGRIARMLEEVKAEETPLERRMATIGQVLAVICLAVAAGAVLLGVYKGVALWPMSSWMPAWWRSSWAKRRACRWPISAWKAAGARTCATSSAN